MDLTPDPARAKRRVRRTPPTVHVIGWREWIALPALGTTAIKAKIDTGARTSALHAFDVRIVRGNGVDRVRFKVHPIQRNSRAAITAEEELVEQRWVRSSSGHRMLRPVIVTPVELMGHCWDIELTLTNRDEMGFRMLLGREAVRGRFMVDAGRSFVAGRPLGTHPDTDNKTEHSERDDAPRRKRRSV